MQGYGTDYCRETKGQDYWIKRLDQARTRMASTGFLGPRDELLITDIRFQDEANYVLEKGGYLIRVLRHSDGSDFESQLDKVSHKSETLVADIPVMLTVQNDGSLAYLQRMAELFVRQHLITAYERGEKLCDRIAEGAPIPGLHFEDKKCRKAERKESCKA